MKNQQLIGYIKQMLDRGSAKSQIKETLQKAGWQDNDIEENFTAASAETPAYNPATMSPVAEASTLQQSSAAGAALPQAGVLLGEAWQIIKPRIMTLLGILLMPFTIGIVALIIFFVFVALRLDFVGSSALAILIALIAVVVVAIVQAWSYIAVVYVVKDRHENIGFKEAFKRSRSKILSFIWLGFLMNLIIGGASFLLFVPGLIFAIWFSLAVFVYVSENIKGLNALLKSKEYVRGYWPAIFWRILIMAVFFVGLLVTTTIAISVLSFVLAFIGNPIIILVIQSVALLAGNLVFSLLLTPFFTCYMLLIYEKLKAIKKDMVFMPSAKAKVGFIIVGIIGIVFYFLFMLAILFAGLNDASSLARDAQRKIEVVNSKNALEIYYDEHSSYPATLEEAFGQGFVPKDPLTDEPYEYRLISGGQDYELCAEYEEMARECYGFADYPSANTSYDFDDTEYDDYDFDFD